MQKLLYGKQLYGAQAFANCEKLNNREIENNALEEVAQHILGRRLYASMQMISTEITAKQQPNEINACGQKRAADHQQITLHQGRASKRDGRKQVLGSKVWESVTGKKARAQITSLARKQCERRQVAANGAARERQKPNEWMAKSYVAE